MRRGSWLTSPGSEITTGLYLRFQLGWEINLQYCFMLFLQLVGHFLRSRCSRKSCPFVFPMSAKCVRRMFGEKPFLWNFKGKFRVMCKVTLCSHVSCFVVLCHIIYITIWKCMEKYLIQGHIKNESQIGCYSHNHSELWFPFPSCQTDFSITACQTLQLIIHSSVSARQQHYSGAKHAKRVRACLEEWGKRNPGEANITNKKKHTNKQTNKQSKQRNITNKQKFVSPYGHNAALPKVSYYHTSLYESSCLFWYNKEANQANI